MALGVSGRVALLNLTFAANVPVSLLARCPAKAAGTVTAGFLAKPLLLQRVQTRNPTGTPESSGAWVSNLRLSRSALHADN
jgi:hypothetical protein